MKKKSIGIVYLLLMVMVFSAVLPPNIALATEQQEVEDTQDSVSDEAGDEETTEETEHPESYYLPIDSDSIEGWPAGPQIEGEAAIVMEAETGAILYNKNMEAKEYPASITKIMTTLVAIENGDLDSKVTFSDWAVNSLEADSSRLWMDVGEKLTLRQALYGIMLESANDCANAVAEKIGGSEEAFVEMMNQKAAELGCTNTHFVNAHGLHDENHYTCAKDMALIMQAALQNETFVEIMGTVEYTIPASKHVKEEHVLVNHQKMLYKDGFYYKGCMGGKTGFTNAALNTLVTVARRKGRTLICVILRTNGPEKICYETEDLLDYGFKKFTTQEIPITDGSVTRNDLLGTCSFGKAAIMNGTVFQEPMLYTSDTALVTLPKKADVSQVEKSFCNGNEFDFTYNGWQVGSVPVTFNTVDINLPEWEIINPTVVKETVQTETETEQSVADTAKNMLQTMIQGWNDAWNWIYDHDIAAAVVGLILILLLLPVLVIAYIRNRSSQKIRKQRQKEREERVRIEKDIDSKSISEIEAELRAELEKDRRAKEILKQQQENQVEEKEEGKA